MTEKLHNKIKDININLINNYNSEITKNQIPIRNINSNLNTNSFSQENIFNELLNSLNFQESKNNSSFSESINSNQDNQNIIMNKDQLFHIFVLFQRLLYQNQNLKNNNNNIIEKNEESTNNTINNNMSKNVNAMKEFPEYKSNNIIQKLNEGKLNINKYLKKNKSDSNVLEKKEKKENIDVKKKKETQKSVIENRKNRKNPYDDIPIKLNTINFIELVEKKLADEENKKNKSTNKNYIRKIISKVKNEKKKTNKEKDLNDNFVIKEEKTNTYRESINKIPERTIIKRNNNNLINYSFDKDETKMIIPETKNTIENSTSIIDNMNTIFIKGECSKKKIVEYEISKNNFTIRGGGGRPLDEIIQKNNEKEQILNQKIKEMNKEIIKLKEEQNKINKIKLEYEKYTTKLNNDIYQFSQKKDEFEKFRKNELIKIKNNKKNLLIESKNIKEIKNKNQELINKSKKDKEIIEYLKNKINKLQQKQKENNNMNIINDRKYKSPKIRTSNLSESKLNIMKRKNTQYKTQTHKLFNKNNTTNIKNINSINNIFCNSIDEKIIDKESTNLTLNRNTKNVIKKENDNISMSYNKTNQNESSGFLSISQRILDNSNNNIKHKKENINERLLFSPIACKTSIGFGLKKISIKLNNSPKQNVRLQKKIYENEQVDSQILDTYPKNERVTKNRNINNFNSLSNIFLKENRKSNNIKIGIQKNKKELLNKSANNSKSKMNSKIININKNKIAKEEYDFIIPKKYTNKVYKLLKSIKSGEKIINTYTNDKKEIIYNNGTRKEIYKNEHQIIYYANGDIKQIFSDGKISLFNKESKKVQTNLTNGTKIYKMKNGQIEKHFPDGTKLIKNNEKERYIYNDGSEETFFSDAMDKNKDIIMEKTLEEDN